MTIKENAPIKGRLNCVSDNRNYSPFSSKLKVLIVRLDTGGFRCMVCGAKGGDVLAFHMQRHGLRFIDAAKSLSAWEVER